ncbi:mucin-5AC [Salmo salar]|uniref:Mucin-5AC n=1 Tax=Salmo salar TaxID=8030 RepID=A0A1S3NTF0_SALSA|nr:mucin-5AC-like [Salmo salar]|eukprot:XP_014018677.1 PREDICTED: mucin-5AC-like [Salmo salar]
MERKRLVFVLFLWMLPLGLNSTVIPQPNSHSTDFRSSEVTATSDKVSPLEMAQEHLNNAPDEGNHSTIAPSGELKFTVKREPQTPDQVSTRYISSYLPSIHPLSASTKRKSQSPQDPQTTRYKNNSKVEITADGAEETSPTMGNQPLVSRVIHSGQGKVSPISSQTTSPTTNQPTEIQTGPGPTNLPMSQSNDSTERIRPMPTGVGFGVTPTRAEFTLNTGGKTQLPSTPSQAPVTSRKSTPSHPTERGPTGPSELPSAATSPTTLPPSIAMTKYLTHISTPWTSTQSAKTLATTAASVTASIAVTSTKGQSPLMVPTAKHVAAATTTKNKPKPPPSKMSNKDKNKTTGNHGTVVAVLIGVTLVLMLLSFGVIFVTKRRHQRMQLQNTAWAGPSPFLDSGVQSRLDNDDSSDDHLRGSNRISFSGFLSQQLSKRLSLLQETDEEFRMGEIPTGSTFGRETVSDDVQLSNGAAAVHKEKTQAEEVQPLDNSSSPPPPTSSETTATAHTHDHQPPTSLQVVDLGPDNALNRSPSRTPPDIPEAIPPPLLDVYLGPPSGQASPPPPESKDLPTPPPDLP